MTTNVNDNSGLSKFNEGIDKLGNNSERIADSLSGETEFAKDIMASFKSLGDEFKKMKNIVEDAKNSTKTFKSFLGDKLTNVGESLKSYGEFLEKSTFSKLSSGFKELKEGFGELGKTIEKSNVVSTFKTAFKDELEVLSDISGGIKGIWLQAKTVASKFLIPFALGAFKFFKDVWGKLKNFGKKSSRAETEKNDPNFVGPPRPSNTDSDKNSKSEKEKKGLFEGIKDKFSKIKESIGNFISGLKYFAFKGIFGMYLLINSLVDKTKKILKFLKKTIGLIIKSVGTIFKSIVGLGKFILKFKVIFAKILLVFGFLIASFDGIKAGIENYMNGGSIGESILVAIGGVFNSLSEQFFGLVDFLGKAIGSGISFFGELFGFDMSAFKNFFKDFDLKKIMINFLTETFLFIDESYTKIKNGFVSVFEKISTKVISFFSTIGESIGNFINSKIEKFKEFISSVGETFSFDNFSFGGVFENLDFSPKIKEIFDFFIQDGIVKLFSTIGEFIGSIGEVFTFSDLKKAVTGDFSFFDDDDEKETEKSKNQRKQGNVDKRNEKIKIKTKNETPKIVFDEKRKQGEVLENKNIKAEKEKIDQMTPKTASNNVYTEGNKINQSNTNYNRTEAREVSFSTDEL